MKRRSSCRRPCSYRAHADKRSIQWNVLYRWPIRGGL